MEPKRRGLRSAALVSSVLLVGAFVAYSTGIALFMGGSKSSSVFQTVPTTPSQPETQPGQKKYMSGSKSTFILVPGAKEPPNPDENAPPAAPVTPPVRSGE